MKRLQLTYCLLLLLSMAMHTVAQTRFSVLGDSYSTYGGYVTPETNACWYNGTDGGTEKKNDVRSVEQTWWHLLATQHGLQLDTNNSYSGSTICHTGYYNQDFSDRSFITRLHRLGSPEVILVFGGTNDSWIGVPLGAFQYGGWSKQELYSFRPAFCYLMAQLRQLYPDARIYNITNTQLSAEVTESMERICRYYGIPNIRLHDIDKQQGHPSVAGMKSICEQVWQAIKE